MRLEFRPLHRRVFIALFAGIAFVMMYLMNVPILPAAPYLKYEPSGSVILLCGLLTGPAGALQCALIKAFFFFLAGGGDLYGSLSDFAALAVFAGTASFLAGRRKPGLFRLILCCLAGGLAATLVMIPLNYVILHLQFGMTPQAVSASMVYIIPYNLLKTGCNSVIATVLAGPLYRALSSGSNLR